MMESPHVTSVYSHGRVYKVHQVKLSNNFIANQFVLICFSRGIRLRNTKTAFARNIFREY